MALAACRLLAAVGLCTALAACGEHRLADSDLTVATRAIAVAPSRAIVIPPVGGPAIVSVTQRSYDNAVSQEIRLATRGATPGENAIYAALFTAADVVETEGVEGSLLKMPSLDDYAIAREMEERLPGVVMMPSAVFVQNKYGPFGYAFGRGIGGEACLFAWQRLARGDSLFRPRSGAVSVRIRLCDPQATEASLLRIAYDYAISGSLSRSGWRPIDDAPPPSSGLGEAGAPVYPVVAGPGFGEAPERPSASVRARPRTVAPRVDPAEPPPPDRRIEGYPIVPRPAGP
ncbi:hypothetical protein ASE63_11695 [Bosea sp. Root381]|uniref:cellulose biosynthesis protein BcsN n=1 Tax=Bosea sp. Root381 TaxID=1736524 RepID=UPI0006FD07F0|nr:cellulose biosynthesis protein BcsN [Bosea sp. Root381]KRD96350.1 hypothetical protein ASE63_11695 [Bosea sp. Root381]